MHWSDRRLLELFGIDLPIIAAPMANFAGVDLAVAVAAAGGLGSLPCASISPVRIREEVATFRARSNKQVHLNFFCHAVEPSDPAKEQAWLDRIAPYYAELGVAPPAVPLAGGHAPFGEPECAAVEELRPDIVSFHFGLPRPELLARVRSAGCTILSSATSLREAVWLAERGVDAIIAQGAEAGGHRGMFHETEVAMQMGTFGLVRAISDAVPVPVIAAGGIADGNGIAAALVLGASAVQIGTAYLTCPESTISPLHRQALADPRRETAITNVLTGRPARGVVNRFMREQGPIDRAAPAFQRGRAAIAPLRAKAEAQGSADFSPLWSGQGMLPACPIPAGELTRDMAEQALGRLKALARD